MSAQSLFKAKQVYSKKTKSFEIKADALILRSLSKSAIIRAMDNATCDTVLKG